MVLQLKDTSGFARMLAKVKRIIIKVLLDKTNIIQWVRKPDCKNDTDTKNNNNVIIPCWNTYYNAPIYKKGQKKHLPF